MRIAIKLLFFVLLTINLVVNSSTETQFLDSLGSSKKIQATHSNSVKKKKSKSAQSAKPKVASIDANSSTSSNGVDTFLSDLSSSKRIKAKAVKVSSQKSSDTVSSFLSGLSSQENYQEKDQQEAKKAQSAEQLQQLQDLNLIQNYYGNPEYKSAMEILNNAQLLDEYEQAIRNMQMFFFNYTQNILSKYHASKKKSGESQNTSSITSFLKSFSASSSGAVPTLASSNNESVSTSVVKSNSASAITTQASNKSESAQDSFLDSLKG